MKSTRLIAVFLVTVGAARAEPGSEPAELTTLRTNWEKARHQAIEPIDQKYEQSLDALKSRFSRQGKLEEALAVDAELKNLEGERLSSSANPGGKLQIVSALYREVGKDRSIDTTAILRRTLEARAEGIRLNTKFGADGQDPAPAALKETVVTYTYRGETKTKTFPENYDLKFKEDLK